VQSCTIEWPEAGELRVREIISRARSIPTWKVPSIKLDRWVHAESDVECDGVKLLDVSPSVTSFCEQPCRIRYIVDGTEYTHIPDTHAQGRLPKPLLVEFKKDDDRELQFALQRGAALAPHLYRLGYDYRVVLGSTLRRFGYLQNAKWIFKHARRPLPLGIFERARQVFRSDPAVTFRKLTGAFGELRNPCWPIARLVFDGQVGLDMRQPITDDTVFYWHSKRDTGESPWLLQLLPVTK